MTPADILRLPDSSTFHSLIDDDEIRALSELLAQRVATVRSAKRIASMLLRLKQDMQDDVVHFRYDKRNGEDRKAYGTRSKDIINRHGGDPKGEQREGPPSTFNYFDLIRSAWRSFRPENLVSIDENYTI